MEIGDEQRHQCHPLWQVGAYPGWEGGVLMAPFVFSINHPPGKYRDDETFDLTEQFIR
jgi:hypothetical protein